jgi:hypothetical protein
MAVTEYIRSLSLDFNGSVNYGNLHSEITLNPNISTSLFNNNPFSSDAIADTVTIRFDNTLTSPEETELDTVIIPSHAGIPSPVRILSLLPNSYGIDPLVAPVNLDYKTGLTSRLHAKRTIVLGEVTQVEWYQNYDGTTFSDLVIKVNILYTRDPMGLAIYRDTTREWYHEDSTLAQPIKSTRKWYLGNDRSMELEKRAKNALAAQKTAGLGAIVVDQITNHGKTQSEAVAIGIGYADEWFTYFSQQVSNFKETNSRQYWDAIIDLENQTPELDLQWARDTPGFMDAVKTEVNFGGWV